MKASVLLSYAVATANATSVPEYVGSSERAAFDIALRSLPGASSYQPRTAGFQNPSLIPSVGGHAICIQGNISVQTSAMNIQLNYTEPINELDLTNTIVEYLQINSSLLSEILQGSNEVSGTYNINSKLCFPAATRKINNDLPLQFLIHGVGFDKTYWLACILYYL